MPEIKDLPVVPGNRTCRHCACFLPAPAGAKVHGFCRLNPPHAVEAMVQVPWLMPDGSQRVDRSGQPQLRSEKVLAHGYPSVPRFFTCWQWRGPDCLPGEKDWDVDMRNLAANLATMQTPEGPPFDQLKDAFHSMARPLVFGPEEDGESPAGGADNVPSKAN